MNRSHDDERFDALIDEAARAIRDDALSEAQLADAARRFDSAHAPDASAGSDRSLHAVLGCADIQALLGERHAGTLPADRALLVDSHLRGCVTCRAAYKRVRSGAPALADRRRVAASAPAARRSRAWAWAAAAACLVAATGAAYYLQPGWFGSGPGSATVVELDGLLLNIGRVDVMPIARGSKVGFGETVRTGKDAGAILVLADGSRVELAPRTEMTLERAADGTELRLAGGQMIVEASPQGSGHLYVTTDDCRVAVKGTVFSVTSGAKGSRVSVLEGAVEVDAASGRERLEPGQQFTSNEALAGSSLEAEIAWSRNAERHRALLAELRQLSRDIDALPAPELRTSTHLLDLMPANTVMFLALPNVSGRIDEAWRLFLERVHSNGVLAEWWKERAGEKEEAEISAVVEKIRLVGEELGDEIAVAVLSGQDDPVAGVAIAASVRNDAAFRALMERESAEMAARHGGSPFRLVADPTEAPETPVQGTEPSLSILTRDGLMLGAAGRAPLEALAAAADAGRGGFVGTPLHGELTAAYRDGAVWLGGFDVAALVRKARAHDSSASESGDPDRAFSLTGLSGAKYLVVEGDGEADSAMMHATLVFDGPRRGVLSWLAAPAPIRALRFVSPDATFAAAAVVKDPSAMLDEVYTLLGQEAGTVRERLGKLGAELGLDVRDDLLAPLGGEVVVALDGPVLPTPAWKVAVEVYDPLRLQRAIEQVVTRAAQEAAAEQRPVPVLTTAEEAGRTFYQLGTQPPTMEVHYTFADGYLLVASQRALLAQAIAGSRTGVTLVESSEFTRRLPRDGHANVSALVWRDTGRLFDALSSMPLPDAAVEQIRTIESGPMLDVAYGEESRITVAGARRSLSALMLPALLGASGAPDSPAPRSAGESISR